MSVYYFRILIWGMCFYMSNQLLQSLLNAEKQYGFSSFTAMMNNLILTAAVLLMGHKFGLSAMAMAGAIFLYCSVSVFTDQEQGLWTADGSLWLAGFPNLEALPPGSTDFLWKCNLRVESAGGQESVVGYGDGIGYS